MRVTIPLERLDDASVAYLKQIEQTHGESVRGIFIPRYSEPLDPRAGGLWLIFLGGIAWVSCYFLASPSFLDGHSLTTISYIQAALGGLGLLWVLCGYYRLQRPLPEVQMGAFTFVDGASVWDVTPERAEIVSLDKLLKVESFSRMTGSTFLGGYAVLYILGDTYTIEAGPTRELLARLARFLDALIVLRDTTNESLKMFVQDAPHRLGSLASQLSAAENLPEQLDFSDPPEIPHPKEKPAPSPQPGRGWIPWAAAAAAIAIGVPGFLWLDTLLHDNFMYEKASAAYKGQLEPLDAYLNRYPDGRHAEKVRAVRDDRRYEIAESEARNRQSPSSVRLYLADAQNVRHRAEAQVLINKFYDEAIASLKERARLRGMEVDKELFDATLALIDALKFTNRPVVSVGFAAAQDPLPVSDLHKQTQKMVYDARMSANSELHSIAANSLDKSAIIGLGRTFEPDQTRNRQGIILERLRDAVTKGVGSDILTIQEAAAGEKPVLEVKYHVFAPGNLYLYTKEVLEGFGSSRKPVKRIAGLLRGYDVEWTIVVTPPGQAKSFVCKLESAPANRLKYDSDDSDPDWAPYAIILYSSFYDMSSRMIKNFAIEPPPAPESYSFRNVVGTRK